MLPGKWQKGIKNGNIGEVYDFEHAWGQVAGVKFFPDEGMNMNQRIDLPADQIQREFHRELAELRNLSLGLLGQKRSAA